MFGPGVHVRNGNHPFEIPGQTIQGANDPASDRSAVVIEDDVWVGEDATILPKASLGEGAVVGSRTVVNRAIPPYVVVVGDPCRIVRPRFSDPDLRRHLALRGREAKEIERVVQRRQAMIKDWEEVSRHVQDSSG